MFTLNLLTWKPVRRLTKSPWFPIALQAATLIIMIALAINGWGIGTQIQDKALMTLRKTSLTTLAVWGLWWPGMIGLAIFAGRLWCTVCPMELVSRMSHVLATRLGFRRFVLGSVLRGGWVALAAYVVLQLMVAGHAIHRVPHYTSVLLLVLGVLALGAGLLFREDRAFCKAFCPASALLSVYGRFTPLQLDKVTETTCDECKQKDCVAASNRDRFDGRSCPSLIRPFDRTPSDGCVLCFQCAKSCPTENIGFGLRSGDAKAQRHTLLKPFEAAFVFIAAGFVAHEVVGEVKWLDAIFHKVPAWLHQKLPVLGFGWFEGIWFLGLFPLAFWAIVLLGGRAERGHTTLGEHLRAVATGAAPVVALAHLAKALAKVGSWGAFLPLALRDPAGMATMEALTRANMRPPASLWGLSIVGGIILLGMLVLGWQGLKALRRASTPSDLAGHRHGFVGTAVFFTVVLILWVLG